MDKIKLIEAYLDGSMDESSQKKFNNFYRQDSQFVANVKLFKESNEAILDDEIHNFRHNLSKTLRNINNPRRIDFSFKKQQILYPLAASILLLIGFGFWKMVYSPTPDRLYAKYYEPYSLDMSTRTLGIFNDNFESAYDLYQEGKYNSSFAMFQNFLIHKPQDQTARFFMCLSAIELENYDLALNELYKIEIDPTNPFAIHAQWYRALLYFKKDQADKASQILVTLAGTENFYSEKAGQILRKL